MAKKVAKKVKKKQKQKQKQKQSQRTSVTVNINTKSKTKSKAPRATNGNTNRVLQQFAQPIITLPSNLINPPPMPQYGLNPSQLQTRRNDGEAVSMGQRLGSDSELRERMRATIPNDEQSLSGFSFDRSDSLRNYPTPESSSGVPSNFTVGSDTLSNYSEPSNAYTASLSSGFTVGTDTPSFRTQVTQTNFRSPSSSVSDVGRDLQRLYSEPNYSSRGRPPIQPTRTPFRGSMGGLSAEVPQSVGVPMGGNPSLKSFSGMEFLPRKPLSDIGAGTIPMSVGDADTRSYSSY